MTAVSGVSKVFCAPDAFQEVKGLFLGPTGDITILLRTGFESTTMVRIMGGTRRYSTPQSRPRPPQIDFFFGGGVL